MVWLPSWKVVVGIFLMLISWSVTGPPSSWAQCNDELTQLRCQKLEPCTLVSHSCPSHQHSLALELLGPNKYEHQSSVQSTNYLAHTSDQPVDTYFCRAENQHGSSVFIGALKAICCTSRHNRHVIVTRLSSFTDGISIPCLRERSLQLLCHVEGLHVSQLTLDLPEPISAESLWVLGPVSAPHKVSPFHTVDTGTVVKGLGSPIPLPLTQAELLETVAVGWVDDERGRGEGVCVSRKTFMFNFMKYNTSRRGL